MGHTSLNKINSDFLNTVEEKIENEKSEFFGNQDRDINNIYNHFSHLDVTDDDPVSMFMDIIRSRITEYDINTAKKLLDNYIEHTGSIIENRYQEFKTSHTNSQLVLWYFFSPIQDSYRIAKDQGNNRFIDNIISLLTSSIKSWKTDRDTDGVPEFFFRVFTDITTEYISECDSGQARSIASNYLKISKIIASDFNSSESEITGAMIITFVSSSLTFAMKSIDRGFYKSASLINMGLRFIIEAYLKNGGNPDRVLLHMGLIGERFAKEEAKSRDIVEIGNEVLTRDLAEDTILTLVTFKDKIEDPDNEFTSNTKYLEFVIREIDRINNALEEKDRDIASKVDSDEDLVLKIIRGGRLFRQPFSIEELYSEIDVSESIDKIREICNDLEEVGAFESRENNKYSSSYDDF